MSMKIDPELKRFPMRVARPGPADGGHGHGARAPITILDLTARDRMGVRGPATRDWCAGNGLAFPQAINGTASTGDVTVARLGRDEVLVMSRTGGALPGTVRDLPTGAYDGFRGEGWAWFRLRGPDLANTLAECTSVDIDPGAATATPVVQTRFCGLDAVLIVGLDPKDPCVELFFDIASHGYVLNRLLDIRPGLGFTASA